MASIANATIPRIKHRAEVTLKAIDAGESVILAEVGGADLGGFFSARELAVEVFLAMCNAMDNSKR
jgi:hypothetical protein